MSSRRKILVVGAGWIGRKHVEAFLGGGRAEVSICEPDEIVRTRTAHEYSVDDAFAILDQALARRWDAAVVATPADTHLALGRKLTSAGIPVLVEKPLALSAAGLTEWRDEVEAAGVPVMVGYVFRCHPVLEALRHELQAGRIGRPLQVVAQRGAHLPARRPDYASTYYATRAQGGGVVQDILSHVVNAAEWLVGPTDRIVADAAHLQLPGVHVEDTVNVLARHGSVVASYSVNQHQHAAEFTLEVHGTQGSLRADFPRFRWDSTAGPDRGWTPHALPALSQAQWFLRQANVFLDVAEGRVAPPCPLQDGIVTLQTVLATLRGIGDSSAWTSVSLPCPQTISST